MAGNNLSLQTCSSPRYLSGDPPDLSFLYVITGLYENTDHLIVPDPVIHFLGVFNAVLLSLYQTGIFRAE
jgi:hypothetical protein